MTLTERRVGDSAREIELPAIIDRSTATRLRVRLETALSEHQHVLLSFAVAEELRTDIIPLLVEFEARCEASDPRLDFLCFAATGGIREVLRTADLVDRGRPPP